MFLRIYSAAVLMFTPRSPHWPAVRERHLAWEPECQWCGTREHLQVHHVMAFHDYPELETDDFNLITLCMGPMECHWQHGHFGKSWLAYDPDIRRKCEEHRRAA